MADWTQPIPPERTQELLSPEHKLFGFQLSYADGQIDYGLVVASSQEAAQLHMENLTLAGLKAVTITEQIRVVDTLLAQFGGVVFFAKEGVCN